MARGAFYTKIVCVLSMIWGQEILCKVLARFVILVCKKLYLNQHLYEVDWVLCKGA